MLSKRSSLSVLSTVVVVSALGAGCSAKEEGPGGNAGTSSAAGASAGAGADDGAGESGAGSGGASGSGGSGGTSGMNAGSGGEGGDPVIPGEPTKEERFPDVTDWVALDVVYDHAYTADDGVHDFKVPFHVMGTEVGIDAWFSIPEGAVAFEEDLELAEMGGGVIATIVDYSPEIIIGVQAAALGGTAPLTVTEATPDAWAMGEARYDNGIDYDFPELTADEFALMLLMNPDWSPPPPEPNTSCISCHGSNAKYFEIQHTPTQAARFSDEQLRTIMTKGMKPAGIGFRVLPDMLGDKTNVELYAEYHAWQGTDEELQGLIVYLRSLTPIGQGDIKLPDGSYAEPGTDPSMPSMPSMP